MSVQGGMVYGRKGMCGGRTCTSVHGCVGWAGMHDETQ